MKKKLLSILTLLLCLCTGAWAVATEYKGDFSNGTIIQLSKTYVDEQAALTNSWITLNSTSTGTVTATDPESMNKVSVYRVKQWGSRYIEFWVTGVSKITFYANHCGISSGKAKDTRTMKATVDQTSETNAIELVSIVKDATVTQGSGDVTLDPTGNHKVRVYATGDMDLYAMVLTVPAAAEVPDAPTFDPASGTSVPAGTEITLASTGAETIVYQWGSAAIDGSGDWTGAETYSAENLPVVPSYGSANNVLSVKATNTIGSTYGSATYTIIAEQVEAPTITAGGYFFTDNKSVEIACATEGATIKYSYDNSTWNDYSEALSITETKTVYAKAVKSGMTDSEVVSDTYTKFVKSDLASINTAKTWTFPTSLTLQLKEDGSTYPAKYDEYFTYADIAIINSHNLGSFDGTTLAFSGEYPYRGTNGAQNANFQFKTTVPGIVTIEFSNTGKDNKERWIKVNGTTGSKEASGTTHQTESFNVSAGTVTVSHVNKDGNLSGGLRVYYIQFTPTPEPTDPVVEGDNVYLTTTDNMAGWRAFYDASQGYTVDEGTKVFVAPDEPENDVVTFTKIDAIPAGTAVVLYHEDETDSHKMTLTKAEVDSYGGVNLLKWTTSAVANKYRLGYGASGVGFYPYSGTPASGAIYLDISSVSEARALTFAFDEGTTTGISSTRNDMTNDNVVYDLQGRKINGQWSSQRHTLKEIMVNGQLPKGLYIVNGKKVVVK